MHCTRRHPGRQQPLSARLGGGWRGVQAVARVASANRFVDSALLAYSPGIGWWVGAYGYAKSTVRSTRSSATELEEVPLGVRLRHGGGTLVGGRGLAVPAQPPQQIGSRGVERVVGVQVQLVH